MAIRRRVRVSGLALGIVWKLGALTATAQSRGTPPDYLPEPGAKDLKSVLFNWAWHMVMLRGIDEHEVAVSLEYQGFGQIQVNGQPCTLTKYRSSTNYQTPGQRKIQTPRAAAPRRGDSHPRNPARR